MADGPAFACRRLARAVDAATALIRDVERYSIESSTQRVLGYLLQYADPEQGAQSGHPAGQQNLIASRLNLTPKPSRACTSSATPACWRSTARDITLLDLDKVRAFGCG